MEWYEEEVIWLEDPVVMDVRNRFLRLVDTTEQEEVEFDFNPEDYIV